MKKSQKKVPELRFKGSSDDWEQRELGMLAEFSKGIGYSKNDLAGKGSPVILYGRLYTKYEIVIKDVDTFVKMEDGSVISEGNEVIVPASGETAEDISRASVVGKSGIILGGDLNIIKPKSKIDSVFLALTISNGRQQKEMSRRAQGKSVVHLHNSDLKKVNLMYPDLREQQKISTFFQSVDHLIALHQRKLDLFKSLKKGYLQRLFPSHGEKQPLLRFANFTGDWEQRKLGDEFKRVNERNDGSFGRENWISVAKMYFQDPEKVQSNNIDTRTYVMREGDIAFEGHPNAEFMFGRFVANDIGPGVVSELFPIYRHKDEYDNNYWKHAIQLERIMAPIFAKSITSSGNSSNKLDQKHFLRQSIYVPSIDEQHKIGDFFQWLDRTLALHQQKSEKLIKLKQVYLQKLFI